MCAHRSQKIKEVADPDVSQTQRLAFVIFLFIFLIYVYPSPRRCRVTRELTGQRGCGRNGTGREVNFCCCSDTIYRSEAGESSPQLFFSLSLGGYCTFLPGTY